MATTSAYTGRTVVRLSQVPADVRERAACEYIEEAGLNGPAAIELRLLAMHPREDPALEVPVRKWEAVQAGRLPAGKGIYRWLEGLT